MGNLSACSKYKQSYRKINIVRVPVSLFYSGGAGRLAAGAISGQPLPLGLAVGISGLHRPFLVAPSGASESLELQATAMKRARVYLEGFLVSNRLIDLMMSRPSNDIYGFPMTT